MTKKAETAENLQEQEQQETQTAEAMATPTPTAPQPERERVTFTADSLDGIHEQFTDLAAQHEGDTLYAGAVVKSASDGKWSLTIDIVKQPKTE